MLSKEEYFQRFEDKMLEKLFSNYSALNKNLIFLYSLLLILLLLEFNFVDKIALGGTEFNLSTDQRQFLMPILILIPYLLVNNAIRNIVRIVEVLKANASEILAINPDSRPFLVQDLEIYSSGIAGIQFQISKWIVKKRLSRKIDITFNVPIAGTFRDRLLFSLRLPVKLLSWGNQLGVKAMLLFIWILLLVFLYILPLLASIAFLYNNSLHNLFEHAEIRLLFSGSLVLAILLLAMIVYTLVSNWILYSLFFNELSELKKDLTKIAYRDLRVGSRKILRYYTGRQ